MKNRIIETLIISVAIITLGLFIYLGLTYLGDSIVTASLNIESGLDDGFLGGSIRAGLNNIAGAIQQLIKS
ncbi:MAG: hypothetical protein II292_01780 [Clostridia bacterium]|nr:hypothetical protein [Clostridia bacterium]